MTHPLVSVLMTSYNREKYIAEAIRSVLASTYENFELIIVDDCSKDKTVEIARSFAEQDKRIKIFVNDHNLGQFENRNLAAKYATGIYLKYLDSDDMLYPTGLEVLVNMMAKYPEAGYGLCSLIQDDERPYPYMLAPKAAYETHFFKGNFIFYKAPLSSIIKKNVFEKEGGFTNPHGEADYEMWLHLSRQYNLVLMPDGIAWYRVHNEQIDFQRRNDPSVAFRYFLVTLKYLSEGCPLDPPRAKAILQRTREGMALYIVRSAIKHSLSKGAEMYRLAGYNAYNFLGDCFHAGLKKIRRSGRRLSGTKK